jgi:soluble lytic murein transglycosylase-like protein
MKWVFLAIFLIISCPQPGLKKIPEFHYLEEARSLYQKEPLYAYSLLVDSVRSVHHRNERAEILIKMYLDQREYERALALLDSIDWSIALPPYEKDIILLKTKRWDLLANKTSDDLLKGIAYYNLHNYKKAIEFLSKSSQPKDYRLILLAKVYKKLNDDERAFSTLVTIDSVSSYLYSDYQNLLFSILINIDDSVLVKKELKKIKKSHLREFVSLKLYEQLKDKRRIKRTAWNLIRNYPRSEGAYYSLKLIKPRTKSDFKACGKVYYYHRDYKHAITHLKKAHSDDAVSYYLGRIYYRRKAYSTALKYFSLSSWAAAYYYRGRIYENLDRSERAIAVYDSLYALYRKSNYATRGYKRKAFLLEDVGDTVRAVETFLKIAESNTRFRAAMQLYKIGDLDKAKDILKKYSQSNFIYWRTKIKEQQGESVDSLQEYLATEHPLSYYSLVQLGHDIILDTSSLETWVGQLGDSAVSFTAQDSLHMQNALRYFRLNEIKYAERELKKVSSDNAMNILYLSQFCSDYGADKQSILYGLRLRKLAEKNGLQKYALELFELIYPVRYTLSIKEQQMDLSLCLAMIWQESLFDPEAESPARAKGLMQIIPSTGKKIAQELRVKSYSLDDPSVSIRFGCHYFLNALDNFNSVALSLAAYNAGPLRVKRWLAKNQNSDFDEFIELIPYNETRSYVKRILSRQLIYKKLLGV